jgi:integrase/recombinase XerD
MSGGRGLDRNEVGAIVVAAGLGTPAEHALISLLALNGLRVSEATGADIEDLSTQRGHRVLAITRKGGKKACPQVSGAASGRLGLGG